MFTNGLCKETFGVSIANGAGDKKSCLLLKDVFSIEMKNLKVPTDLSSYKETFSPALQKSLSTGMIKKTSSSSLVCSWGQETWQDTCTWGSVWGLWLGQGRAGRMPWLPCLHLNPSGLEWTNKTRWKEQFHWAGTLPPAWLWGKQTKGSNNTWLL